MAKYISVLNSDLNESFWKAVQWSDNLQEIQNNKFYTAGVNLSLPKNTGDSRVSEKVITETRTGKTAGAVIIKLAAVSANLVKIAGNKASNSFIKNIEKSLK